MERKLTAQINRGNSSYVTQHKTRCNIGFSECCTQFWPLFFSPNSCLLVFSKKKNSCLLVNAFQLNILQGMINLELWKNESCWILFIKKCRKIRPFNSIHFVSACELNSSLMLCTQLTVHTLSHPYKIKIKKKVMIYHVMEKGSKNEKWKKIK